MEIIGKRVSGIGDDDPKLPGEFCWFSSGGEGVSLANGSPAPLREFAALGFMCPCGCGREGAITVYLNGQPRPSCAGWEWDGNPDQPTLTPSIFRNPATYTKNCGWHGYLTKGVWKSC